MTRSTLPFVLTGGSPRTELDPGRLDSSTAMQGARFWAGKVAGSQAKAACTERIAAVWRDPSRVAEVVAALLPEERQVLAVVRRFGGTISGNLLGLELQARGVDRERKEEPAFRRRRTTNLVLGLCERLALLKEPWYYSSLSYGGGRHYPSVTLPLEVAAAAPLDWKASAPVERSPESASQRTPAQLLVDLEQTMRALEAEGRWKVTRSGALPAAGRNRLGKRLPLPPNDPLEPPDTVALHYALLSALGIVTAEGAEGRLEPERATRFFHLPLEAQVSEWIRAWMELRLWHDGLGRVPDRDSGEGSPPVEPRSMKKAREFLVWALTRIAHGPSDWLDLETFLLDLYVAAGDPSRWFFGQILSWQPRLTAAAGKAGLPAGPERSRAYWMDEDGVFAANVLLSTFVHLGVVERGRTGGPSSERWSFRLTQAGQAVFGAPEAQVQKVSDRAPCLTVQPSHEILLYLDSADGSAVATLGRIATRQSTSGMVQTFVLTRESVYGALERGMTPAAIESFLTSRSRNGLPPNVQTSLAEWSRKRDALVVRGGVALEPDLPEGQAAMRGEAGGARLVVTSDRAARKRAKELGGTVEAAPFARTWKVDEHGVVSLAEPSSLVARARLRRLASFTAGSWQITSGSVRAARALGVTPDQVLAWLGAHTKRGVPPILATAIRNWAGGRGKVFLGDVLLLQVGDEQTFDALRCSERLRPFLEGTLALDCLVVSARGREDVARILSELGFSLDAAYRVEPNRSGVP